MRKMRTSAVLLLAVCLLVAAVAGGCGEEKNGTGKATPGAAKTTSTPADKPTGKATDKVTETPTPAADTPTAEPTETPTPLPTDSPTPLPTDSPTPTPSPSPTPYPEPELVSATTDVNSVRVTWNGDPAETYVVSYRAEGSDETLFVRAEGLLCAVTGLNPGTQYTLSLRRESDPEGTKLGQELKATTAVTGYGDPFRNAQTTLKVGEKSRVVTFTATEGCLGAKVWLEFDTELYEDPMLQHAIYPEGYEPAETAADDPDGQDGQDSGDGQSTQPVPRTFAGGTAFTVTGGHEGYCFLKEDGFYSLHISNEEIDAWVDAERLLIDAMDIFTPEEGPYGIRINRTNAYSSIFSTGGSAYSVDAESEEETRYTMLESEETIWTDSGYNVIEGISGEKLPHYGSELQMPVIWGIARNLLICQKNALASGTTLLIYEGYRPNLTSRTVYRTMVSKRYLDVSVGGYNLANGYTGKDYNAARYIANDSNHNKGIAVDLTIMNYVDTETLGEELPMQTKMHTLDFRGNMLYNNDNSNLLYEIMTQGTDLVPLKSGAEWWHFQLPGDAAKYPQLSKYVFADYEL